MMGFMTAETTQMRAAVVSYVFRSTLSSLFHNFIWIEATNSVSGL